MNHFLLSFALLFWFSIASSLNANAQDLCTVEINGSVYACPGEEVTLVASPGFEQYYWSNGDTGQVISVIAPSSEICVVAVAEDGCVASSTFRVYHYYPSLIYYDPIIGGFQLAGPVWKNIYFYFPPSAPGLSYLWTLNGDTIGFARSIQIDSLEIGNYDLRLEVTAPCGLSTSILRPLLAMEELPGQSKTLCSPVLPHTFQGIPITSPGTYRIYNVDIWGNPTIETFDFEFSDSYLEIFDTISLCHNPIYVGGQVITEPGSYERVLTEYPDDGCHVLQHIEVIDLSTAPLTVSIIDTCVVSEVELGGVYYEESGFYKRIYSNENGCDSINYLILNIKEQTEYELDIAICPGDTFLINGMEFSEPVEDHPVIIPVENDCDSIISLNLSWLDQPERTEHYTMCYGDSIGINGQTYFESYDGFYVSPSMEGGCDTLVYFSVTEFSEIEVSYFDIDPDSGTGDGSISVGITGGKPPYDYLWSTGAGTNSIEQLTTGIYHLTVTDFRNCVATFAFEVGLVNKLEVVEQDPLKPELFPNPASEFITIKWISDQKTVLKIISLTGQQLFFQSTDKNYLNINISELPPGIYFLTLHSGKGYALRKFIVGKRDD